MNSLMSQQKRHLLHSMGIDVWILKDTQSKNFVAMQFWRDQPCEDMDINEPIIQQPPPIQIVTALDRRTQSKQGINKTFSENKVRSDQEKTVVESVLADDYTLGVVPQVKVLPFTLALLTTNKCSILLNYTNLAAEEKVFVDSLAHALNAKMLQLHWPINFFDFQHNDHVSSYVKGFIESRTSLQQIILLGRLPEVVQLDLKKNIIYINDLIKNPMQKKLLWEMIKSALD